jgi:hypothetical protein
MHDRKIVVTAYAGYKSAESPRAFALNDQRIDIIEVQKMWIEEEEKGLARKRFFRVKGSDGFTHTLYYDERAQDWFLRL